MKRAQRTIDREFSIEGVGLHSGEDVVLNIKPAEADSGIRFVRTGSDGDVVIPAIITSVDLDKMTPRNTTIGKNGTVIHTVEHLLAAAYGLQIDNLVVEISACEPPVPSSGSYESYVTAFKEAGIVEQDAPAHYYKIDRPIQMKDGDVEIFATPSDNFRVSFTIQFPNEHIGTQYVTFDIDPEVFEKEISPARTFVLQEDVDKLRELGLIKGGSLENAIVFGEDGVINDEPLRFPDECVRHKVMDLIGDLSLLGQPIQGHIHAVKSGHASNLKFVKKLWDMKNEEKNSGIDPETGAMDISGIEQIIPHRYPFLLVDKIIELEARKRAVSIKNVTANEPFFAGHFPGHPIMPAVLIIEAMAQTGGILMLHSLDDPGAYLVYFLGIDKARFRKPVVPGDQLRLEVEPLSMRSRVCKMRGRAFVGDELVAQAELLASIVKR